MQYKEILKESKSKFTMFAVNLKYINFVFITMNSNYH